jgi:hypothetical protein
MAGVSLAGFIVAGLVFGQLGGKIGKSSFAVEMAPLTR